MCFRCTVKSKNGIVFQELRMMATRENWLNLLSDTLINRFYFSEYVLNEPVAQPGGLSWRIGQIARQPPTLMKSLGVVPYGMNPTNWSGNSCRPGVRISRYSLAKVPPGSYLSFEEIFWRVFIISGERKRSPKVAFGQAFASLASKKLKWTRKSGYP